MEGVGRRKNGEIARKMNSSQSVQLCERKRKVRQKDRKVATKMEKQLVVVQGNGGAEKAKKHTAGEGAGSAGGGRVGMENRAERWKSSREGGKASGGTEQHLERWKSSRRDGKAAAGAGKSSQWEGAEKQAERWKESRKDGKASGGSWKSTRNESKRSRGLAVAWKKQAERWKRSRQGG